MRAKVPGIPYALADGSVQTLPLCYTGSRGHNFYCGPRGCGALMALVTRF